ncbi:MAG: HD domain-containing protein [Candidatus Rickettsia vulgarisii]
MYFSHSLEVAYIVADYLFKTDIIIAAILHDCIEDTELTKEIIAKEFGNEIASYVADLTRIKHDKKISSVEMVRILYQENKKDLLLIKLCYRLHNMQTIVAKPLDKIQKTTLETLHTFVPFARLSKNSRYSKTIR